MEYTRCQQKYCPVNKKELKQEAIQLQLNTKKCNNLLKNYKKSTIKRVSKCKDNAYISMEKINKRSRQCIQKHCKRQLKEHQTSFENPFWVSSQLDSI